MHQGRYAVGLSRSCKYGVVHQPFCVDIVSDRIVEVKRREKCFLVVYLV